MAALANLFSTSMFAPIASSVSSVWKKMMPKDNHDPSPTPNAAEIPMQPLIRSSRTDDVIHGDVVADVGEMMPKDNHDSHPTPNAVEIPMQPLIRSSRTDDVIHGDVVADVGAPLAPIAPTVNIDSSFKHTQKMVVAVANFLMTFAGLFILNPQDSSRIVDSLAEAMASISNVLLLVIFCVGACLILHYLMCLHSSYHLNHIRIQKNLMGMGVVFTVLFLLIRTSSGTPRVLGSWVLALLIVVLVFVFSGWSPTSAGMAAPGLAAGGLDNLPV